MVMAFASAANTMSKAMAQPNSKQKGLQ